MCFPAAVPVAHGTLVAGVAAGGGGTAAAVGAGSLLTAGNVLAATSLVSTAVQTFGMIRQSSAASAESRYRSGIAANNAIIAEQNAQIALQKGEADIADKRRETRQLIGLQKAQLAAQGFDISQGSSIDILGDTAALGELDVLRIEEDAQNRAANFRHQASGFQAESTLGRFASKNQKTAGTLKATSTLITGATTAGLTQLALKP